MTKISSHEQDDSGISIPEGFFCLVDDQVNGLIECAFIEYIFHRKDIEKQANKLENILVKDYKKKKYGDYKSEHGKNVMHMLSAPSGIVAGVTYDLASIIANLYRRKREQHNPDYRDYRKIYYFLIDYPPSKILKINSEKIFEYLHQNEMIVLCSTYFLDNIWYESVRTFSRNFSLDLHNKYFFPISKKYNL